MSRKLAPILVSMLVVGQLHGQEPTIKATVPLVQIPVNVVDQNGEFVYGLTAQDFVVHDEGRPVRFQVDDPDAITSKLAIVIAVQVSDISGSALLKIKKVGSMIGQSVIGANGVAALITYSNEVKVVQSFTKDLDKISDSFRDLTSDAARGGRMLDAVAEAEEILENRPVGSRAAIITIGENKDRGSKISLNDLLVSLQRSAATVYCLDYSAYLTAFTTKGSDYKPPEAGRGWIIDGITETVRAAKKNTAKILTLSTGGQELRFETGSKLENDLTRLGQDIHSRYVVSFRPARGGSEAFHHISIEIRGRPDLRVRGRPGYWPETP